jgi:signal transduction histidine kinase
MKVNFLTKLNTRVFVIPVLLMLLAYLGIGIWFYFSGAAYVLKDFYAAQLLTMLSDKKDSVELWIDMKKKALEEISKNSVLSDNLQKIIGGEASTKAGQAISKYIEDFGQFRSISFLSATGSVIWSTKAELIGKEWPDKDIFTKGLGRADVISGKVAPAANADGLLFSIPFSIKGGQPVLIVAQPNPADLAASLRVEKGFYETGKVSIIDGVGRVVASKDTTDVGNLRYNIRAAGLDGVDYRDGLFYSVSPLRNEQLRLIATLSADEAAKPLGPLKTVYFSFAVLMLAAILLQGIFIAPRLIGKPLSRLLKAIQSIAEGDLRAVSLRKGYAGELKTLAEGVAQMVVVLSKKWAPSDSQARDSEMQLSKKPSSDMFWTEMSTELMELLEGISRKLASASGGDIAGVAAEVKGLVMSLDDINTLMKLKAGPVKFPKREFSVCDILKDVEESCRTLVDEKEIEIIAECPESAASITAVSDPRLMRKLCSSILRSAIRLTEVGTITLLASAVNRDDAEYIEFSVSDTGIGIDGEAIGKILKEDGCYSQYLDLCIGRELAGMLGGEISIESTVGKGSLVAVIIPAGIRTSDAAGGEEIS